MEWFHPQTVRNKSFSQGYLLVEVIMALTVLILIFFALTFATTMAVKVSNFNTEATKADLVLRSRFEDWKNRLSADFGCWPSCGATTIGSDKDDIYDLWIKGTITSSPTADCPICGPNLKKLSVTVTLKNGKEKTIYGIVSRK